MHILFVAYKASEWSIKGLWLSLKMCTDNPALFDPRVELALSHFHVLYVFAMFM